MREFMTNDEKVELIKATNVLSMVAQGLQHGRKFEDAYFWEVVKKVEDLVRDIEIND